MHVHTHTGTPDHLRAHKPRLHTVSPGQALPPTHTHKDTLTPVPQSGAQPVPTHPNPGTWTWSCTPSIPCLVLPSPSFPPFQGWSQSGTKAQCPLLPSPSPLPSGVQRLCPPTAEPERQSEQSGRDIGPRLPEVQGRTGVVRARAAAVGHLGEGVAR